MPFNVGPLELVIVLAIALLVVGPRRLPEMGNAVGKTIREFRKASTEMTDAATLEPEAKPADTTQASASQPAATAGSAPAAAAPAAAAPAPVSATPEAEVPAAAPAPLVEAAPAPPAETAPATEPKSDDA
jgi:TatA/E family protein of Tat protein translocase